MCACVRACVRACWHITFWSRYLLRRSTAIDVLTLGMASRTMSDSDARLRAEDVLEVLQEMGLDLSPHER